MENCFTRHTEDGKWLRIEPLREEADTLMQVSESDRRRAAGFSSPQRRLEFLSWRALLYRELGMQPISYAPCGAPELPEGKGFIGVSHSRRHVALCYSPSAPCAVDIESGERDFSRVRTRYLTPEEQHLSTHPAFECIAWCAKECLYKLARRRELELLRDLQLIRIEFDGDDSGRIEARLLDRICTLHFRHISGDWAVWYL